MTFISRVAWPLTWEGIFRWAFIVCISALSTSAFSSPGAHGPNGEHLNTAIQPTDQVHPKFEVFTEAFEVVGELFDEQLRLSIHDYHTNAPIADATIEIKIAGATHTAQPDKTAGQYIATLSGSKTAHTGAGPLPIEIMILTTDDADLMAAELAKPLSDTDNDHHHAHFPWWQLAAGLFIFSGAFWLGKRSGSKGARS